MTDPLRLGVLSTARIGDTILAGAGRSRAVEVVAVASRDERRAREWAAARGVPRAHGSYEALLGDEDVDAVYISLPNALHVPWSLAALEAGKHVLCEKPLSRRAADVEAAFDGAERCGRVLMEAFMWRYDPQTHEIDRLIRSGGIGSLRLVRAAFGFTLADGSDVRWSTALDGGALMDIGCYCVSALRLLAGEPLRVSSELVPGGDGVDARLCGLMRFDGDVLGSFDCGFDVTPRSAIEVVGDEATIISSDPWRSSSPSVRVLRDGANPEVVPVEPADSYALELDDFAAAVRSGRAPLLGRRDAVGQARAIEALYTSAADGRPVSL